jgi:hypothetical protein
MTTKELILYFLKQSGELGMSDRQLSLFLPLLPPSTLRGSRGRLEKSGKIRKIAEEPNERGYACGVYALTTSTGE